MNEKSIEGQQNVKLEDMPPSYLAGLAHHEETEAEKAKRLAGMVNVYKPAEPTNGEQ